MTEASGRTKHRLLLNQAELDELQRALQKIEPLPFDSAGENVVRKGALEIVIAGNP